MTHDGSSGEDSLIARYFKPLATDPGAFGLTDDAAIIKPDGCDLVVNTDAVVEGVHYLPDDPPETVARKALRVNLSDLAAKGAEPAGFLLTLALRERSEAWLSAFARGLGEDAKTFGCPLLGGDTVSTPGPAMISITAWGRVPDGRMVHRFGAQPGDRVMVTGTIGDASLGLAILQGGAAAAALADDPAARDMLIGRYRVPQPRNALAGVVRDFATASMDVSDGLAGDLAKLCAASNVSADVELSRIPTSPAAARLLACGAAELGAMISGGDDYEILCTVPEARCASFAAEAARAGVTVAEIGVVVAGTTGPRFLDGQGQQVALKRLSFSHF
jgi:thiamine-monophosphate kinase